MGFQLSPGVVTSEIDLTTIVPAVATSTGAYAGAFSWGPVNKPIQISDEVRLVQFFGEPDANTASTPSLDSAKSFFTCANFLAYGNDLRVVRAYNGTNTNNAVSIAGNLRIENEDQYFQNYHNLLTSGYGAFAARYPGAIGNSLKVSVWANSNPITNWNVSVGTANVQLGTVFNGPPGTSLYANNIVANCNDEIHIAVVDAGGLFSGKKGTVLEVYPYVSKAIDAKDDTGNSNYFREVIYRKSKYVYAIDLPNVASTGISTNPPGTAKQGKRWGGALTDLSSGDEYTQIYANTVTLVSGTDGGCVTGNVQTAFDKFKNAEEIDISLVLTGAHGSAIQQYVIDNIVEDRKDCVAFISPPLTTTQTTTAATDIAAYRNSLNRSTSYAVMDSAWKYQYDKYNDMYRWIPANGDMAGLCVRTDATRDPWFSPAGLTRGTLKNVVKLSFNPNKTDRDTLYKNGVNPLVTFPGEGTILFGDKTLLAKPSAFDRINVRRLFIVLEKAIARAARSSLFEFNDEFTRAQFVSIVEPFLRDVKGRRGIYDYRVVCDTTNNTGEVIDRNEFRGDIYVKPARSINFIQLNFVAVRTGVSFDEVVGKF